MENRIKHEDFTISSLPMLVSNGIAQQYVMPFSSEMRSCSSYKLVLGAQLTCTIKISLVSYGSNILRSSDQEKFKYFKAFR